MKGEWILMCPVCLGEDFIIGSKNIDATTCDNCGTWLNDINEQWYLKDGTKLPESKAGHRWITK